MGCFSPKDVRGSEAMRWKEAPMGLPNFASRAYRRSGGKGLVELGILHETKRAKCVKAKSTIQLHTRFTASLRIFGLSSCLAELWCKSILNPIFSCTNKARQTHFYNTIFVIKNRLEYERRRL